MTGKNRELKTVLITGGGSGIGFESAKLLRETGLYRVVLLGKERGKLEEAAEQLGGISDAVGFYVCDLRETSQIRPTVEKIAVNHQGIYALVNNAGVYPFGGVATTTEQSWDETFAVNLKAPFLLIQAVVAAMKKDPRTAKHGGRIVNVSSTAGILPNHFTLAYSVSKAALNHLTRTLAKELGPDNITVNCICPGIVRTGMHEAHHRNTTELEEFYTKRGSAFPLGRVGEPRDIAGAIRFFISEEASWVTGDVFVADGGRLLL
ncbi:MAG: SDR family NAD(P)-dependent oxidoreductase [Oligoflexia bacterium]|nr:SDR family NAD(P)-dependent oxidoreductase [Oligoflexia bacterium]